MDDTSAPSRKERLDVVITRRGLVTTRSQAESAIKLRQITVNGVAATKPGQLVRQTDDIAYTATEQYVSRAGLKLASIAQALSLWFVDKTVLDVGSSTGGFTDYALQHGAKNVIAVDVGTDQMHPSLRHDPRIELHEKTDIRDFTTKQTIDMVVIDVSFISLRDILPHIRTLCTPKTQIVAMVKPQFEAGYGAKHHGVIKNDRMRRDVLKEFEDWTRSRFVIRNKADSHVAGSKGNVERFYLLTPTA